MAPRQMVHHHLTIDHDLQPREFHDLAYTTGVEVILPVVATIVVIMRLGFRKAYGIALNWSVAEYPDYTIAIGMSLVWVVWIVWYYMSELSPSGMSQMPPEHVVPFMKGVFTETILPITCVIFVKVSILLFYLGAFGTAKGATPVLYGLIALQILFHAARIIANVAMCPTGFWTDQSKCVEHGLYDAYIAAEFINMALELAIFVFPMPIVWNLRAPRKKKVGIFLVFCLGAVVIAAMVVRAVVLMFFISGALDLSQDKGYPTLMLISMIEWNIGIVTASIPTFYQPLQTFAKTVPARIRGKSLPPTQDLSHGALSGSPSAGRDAVVAQIDKTETTISEVEITGDEKDHFSRFGSLR